MITIKAGSYTEIHSEEELRSAIKAYAKLGIPPWQPEEGSVRFYCHYSDRAYKVAYIVDEDLDGSVTICFNPKQTLSEAVEKCVGNSCSVNEVLLNDLLED